MLSPLVLTDSARVYLACGSTDLRKSIDGLCAIVTYSFGQDPMGPGLFVFCNSRRDKLKILFWENNGFWLFYRRLEKGRFRWPPANSAANSGNSAPLCVDRRQLQWLLDGMALEQRTAHPPLTYGRTM